MHFTPTSGSWLNLVEVFFGIITRQAIRRGTFTARSRTSSTAIETFIDAWNDRCQPVRVDQDRRRNPRTPQLISSTDSWRRTLAAWRTGAYLLVVVGGLHSAAAHLLTIRADMLRAGSESVGIFKHGVDLPLLTGGPVTQTLSCLAKQHVVPISSSVNRPSPLSRAISSCTRSLFLATSTPRWFRSAAGADDVGGRGDIRQGYRQAKRPVG